MWNLHGSVVILVGETATPEHWADEHVRDDAMAWDRNGIAVAPRCLADVFKSIVDHGLRVRL